MNTEETERKELRELPLEEYNELCKKGLVFYFPDTGEEFKKVYAEYCERFGRLSFLEDTFCGAYGVCGIESEIVQELKNCLASGRQLDFFDVVHGIDYPDDIVL